VCLRRLRRFRRVGRLLKSISYPESVVIGSSNPSPLPYHIEAAVSQDHVGTIEQSNFQNRRNDSTRRAIQESRQVARILITQQRRAVARPCAQNVPAASLFACFPSFDLIRNQYLKSDRLINGKLRICRAAAEPLCVQKV